MRWLLRTLLYLLLVPALGYVAFIWFLGLESSRPSVCRGNVVYGRLEGGGRIAYSGDNFRAYSFLGFLIGRTFVHSAVRNAMRDAYADVYATHPDLRFVYAETSWPWGGRFWPHKTHANGTAVDFHVPVRASDGTVTEIATHALNRFGYDVEFDANGRSGSYQIDFEAMALHLLALDKAAQANGTRIGHVIFDPTLHGKLFATPAGARLAKRGLAFSKYQAWVRHDEHYHVNFVVPCR